MSVTNKVTNASLHHFRREHSGYRHRNVARVFRDERGILKNLNTAEKTLASWDCRAGCARVCRWDGRVILKSPEKKGRLGGPFASTSPSCVAGYRYPPSSSYLSPSSTPLSPQFSKGQGTHARSLLPYGAVCASPDTAECGMSGKDEGATWIAVTWLACSRGIGKAGGESGYGEGRGNGVLSGIGNCRG
jgi:hypothetical protein